MISLTRYGWNPSCYPTTSDGDPARVTAVHRERYEIVSEYGEGFARLKTSVYMTGEYNYPTVGDFVLIRYNPSGDSQIVATLPRRTFFSRRDPTPGRDEQAIAANFDTVFILQSMNHDFNIARLERYLTIARQSGADPVILLTKADLTVDHASFIRCTREFVPDIPVLPVSSHTGFGIDALAAWLSPGKTVVFLGSSGVGKSSLVNAIAGEDLMSVNAIREDDSKGRHTTTHRQLLMLPSGVMLIDTPGMRQLGMWDVADGLSANFADVEQYLGRCRFRDCRHESEPGCAIRAALASGELEVRRWENYRQLEREARYAADRTLQMREKQQKFKEIAKNRHSISRKR